MATVDEFLNGPYGWLSIFGIIILFTGVTVYFYLKYDKYDPEPASRLIFAFILGIVSVIPALFLSLIAGIFVNFNPVLLSVVVAPVVEEVCKIWFVIYLANHDSFDGPLDGLIYGAMVGAGFAAAENVLYGFSVFFSADITSGLFITTVRSVTQIVGHPLYTGLAGVGVGEHKVGIVGNKYDKIWRSMGFHALWNLVSNLVFVLFVIGLIGVIGINVYVLRKELRRTVELDRDAYERGYYEQKQRFLEQKKQRIKQQIQNSQFSQSPPPQQWDGSRNEKWDTQQSQGFQTSGPGGPQGNQGWQQPGQQGPQGSRGGQGPSGQWQPQKQWDRMSSHSTEVSPSNTNQPSQADEETDTELDWTQNVPAQSNSDHASEHGSDRGQTEHANNTDDTNDANNTKNNEKE